MLLKKIGKNILSVQSPFFPNREHCSISLCRLHWWMSVVPAAKSDKIAFKYLFIRLLSITKSVINYYWMSEWMSRPDSGDEFSFCFFFFLVLLNHFRLAQSLRIPNKPIKLLIELIAFHECAVFNVQCL